MSRVEIEFPVRGIDKNWANSKQPPLTSPYINNVRAYGVARKRLRGGQRPGQNNEDYSTRISTANNPIVELLSVTYLEAT